MRPMLASATRHVPTGADWVHEVKWDGMRVLVDVRAGRVRVTSRTERDATVAFPEVQAMGALYDDLLLDGEMVVFVGGKPHFGTLAERFHVTSTARAAALAASAPVTFVVFDALRVLGVDLTSRPWADRRAALERLDLETPTALVPEWQIAWHVPGVFDDGAALLAATQEHGLEGVVSKRRSSRYAAGQRSPDWLKLPHRPRLSVVIGGWRAETDQTDRLGALLVGVPTPAGLHYLGRVGSGIAGRAGASLLATLEAARPRGSAPSPFLASASAPAPGTVPPVDAAGAHWVAPDLVCDVRSLGLTHSTRLRQAAYLGLRPDLTPADVAAAWALNDVIGSPEGEGDDG